jgi:hypothetical protein
MRVLLVEDDAIVAMLLATLVGQLGHVVCAAAASEIEAVDRAAALGPDVVLMDIRLGQQRHRRCSELYARHALETGVDPMIGHINQFNTANETIGDINDLVLGKDGKVAAVIIGIGGFLGRGEGSCHDLRFHPHQPGFQQQLGPDRQRH